MFREQSAFTELEQPFICTMISEPTVAEARSVMKHSEFEGADSFIVNLMGDGEFGLERSLLNESDLEDLFESTSLPSMACYYRWKYTGERVGETDEERMEILKMAVRAGARAVDMVGDTFDPIPGPDEFSDEATAFSLDPESPPREFTTDPDAVERQRAEIGTIHKLGGEVQLTAHTRTHLSPEQALNIATAFEQRNADMVKIVGVDTSWDDLLETLEATVLLNRELDIPFVMMSHGQHGVLGRYVTPFLGSMLCFTQHEYPPGGFYLQPLTENVRSVFDSVRNVTPTREPEEENWL
ncbi:type I 3-dehydroquinate dehydratase [Natrinema caseinilyticum]|uniref:type I 3-dehydroquinate dehydratase n=1 Tax=Natrinema caseinilyticum TaxID=2961570 RepID=UPI0020C567B4|nr:type I 3-dehydroquinate dehydratase [Natrinema caseinilyticum]